MDTEIENAVLSESDEYPFVKGIVPGSMSGAEMLAYWEENGVFDLWAEQYKDIGPGKNTPTAPNMSRRCGRRRIIEAIDILNGHTPAGLRCAD